jgi:hypothetical protein
MQHCAVLFLQKTVQNATLQAYKGPTYAAAVNFLLGRFSGLLAPFLKSSAFSCILPVNPYLCAKFINPGINGCLT